MAALTKNQTTNIYQLLFGIGVVLAVSAAFVHGAPQPGVTEVSETLSCSDLKILLSEGCLDSLSIGDTTLARVNGTKASVQAPFQLLPAEGKMQKIQLLECVDFTRETVCDVDATRQSIRITHYHVTSEERAPGAAVLQGSLLFLLLTPLTMLMMS